MQDSQEDEKMPEEKGKNEVEIPVTEKQPQQQETQDPEAKEPEEHDGMHSFRNILLEIRDDAERKRQIPSFPQHT